jgi:hypothetical protein
LDTATLSGAVYTSSASQFAEASTLTEYVMAFAVV